MYKQPFERIKVEVTYKGEPVGLDYLTKNPNIASLLPTFAEFYNVYLATLNKATKDTSVILYKISCSENGIKTTILDKTDNV